MFNEGGYATLNFIPSIATMLFGVLAGELLRSGAAGRQAASLLMAGAVVLVAGPGARRHVCPIVKRIWTPSWVVYSTGWTCWMLAAFYAVIDVAGFRRWAFPLVVVGMNSIAIYLMAQLMKPFVGSIVADPLRPGSIHRPVRTSHSRIMHAACILVDLLVALSPEDVRQDLSTRRGCHSLTIVRNPAADYHNNADGRQDEDRRSMLRITGGNRRLSTGSTGANVLSFGGAGLLGLSLSGLLRAEDGEAREGKAKGEVAHSVLPTGPTSSTPARRICRPLWDDPGHIPPQIGGSASEGCSPRGKLKTRVQSLDVRSPHR